MVFTVYFIIFIFQDGAGLETLCSAVRELIHSCGDELGWCFTEDQVPFGGVLTFTLVMQAKLMLH